jgi:hypothetical protein
MPAPRLKRASGDSKHPMKNSPSHFDNRSSHQHSRVRADRCFYFQMDRSAHPCSKPADDRDTKSVEGAQWSLRAICHAGFGPIFRSIKRGYVTAPTYLLLPVIPSCNGGKLQHASVCRRSSVSFALRRVNSICNCVSIVGAGGQSDNAMLRNRKPHRQLKNYPASYFGHKEPLMSRTPR